MPGLDPPALTRPASLHPAPFHPQVRRRCAAVRAADPRTLLWAGVGLDWGPAGQARVRGGQHSTGGSSGGILRRRRPDSGRAPQGTGILRLVKCRLVCIVLYSGQDKKETLPGKKKFQKKCDLEMTRLTDTPIQSRNPCPPRSQRSWVHDSVDLIGCLMRAVKREIQRRTAV